MLEVPSPRHPLLRWLSHAFGAGYILVTLLFGPIKWLARLLARQSFIQKYQAGIAQLPPPIGLLVSILSLGLLEISKIFVLLVYRHHGLFGAILAATAAKASLGYLAHTTWHAARPKVIAAYPWAARVDAWVGARIAFLKAYRDRVSAAIRPFTEPVLTMIKKIRTNFFGQKS